MAFIDFFIFSSSLAIVIFSANYFLLYGKRLGIALGVSPFVVGAFIVAFGTSVPEAVIAFISSWNGLLDVAISQTVGSNIANTLLVLGIAAILAKRLVITKNLIDQELPLLASVTAIFLFTILDGTITRIEGIILLIGFVFYTFYIFLSDDKRSYPMTPANIIKGIREVPTSLFMFVLSAIVIAVFSSFTISSLGNIAVTFSVPEGIIAFTILALGTSLPEVVVSIHAVLKKDVELVIGNVIGSNIFNILFVVGIPAAVIAPLTIPTSILAFSIVALLAVTLLFVISGISNRLSRWEGMFFILFYILLIVKIIDIL